MAAEHPSFSQSNLYWSKFPLDPLVFSGASLYSRGGLIHQGQWLQGRIQMWMASLGFPLQISLFPFSHVGAHGFLFCCVLSCFPGFLAGSPLVWSYPRGQGWMIILEVKEMTWRQPVKHRFIGGNLLQEVLKCQPRHKASVAGMYMQQAFILQQLAQQLSVAHPLPAWPGSKELTACHPDTLCYKGDASGRPPPAPDLEH